MADAKIITFGELFSATTDVIPDNKAAAVEIEGLDGNDYIKIDTTDGSEAVKLVSSGMDGGVVIGTAALLKTAPDSDKPMKALQISTPSTGGEPYNVAMVRFTQEDKGEGQNDGGWIGLTHQNVLQIGGDCNVYINSPNRTTGILVANVGTSIYKHAELRSSLSVANTSTPGTNSVAIGEGITAPGNNAIALGFARSGQTHTASGQESIAMGVESTASGTYSMALGRGGTASQTSAIVLGNGESSANKAIAISPDNALASASNCMAIGYWSVSRQPYEQSFGAAGYADLKGTAQRKFAVGQCVTTDGTTTAMLNAQNGGSTALVVDTTNSSSTNKSSTTFFRVRVISSVTGGSEDTDFEIGEFLCREYSLAIKWFYSTSASTIELISDAAGTAIASDATIYAARENVRASNDVISHATDGIVDSIELTTSNSAARGSWNLKVASANANATIRHTCYIDQVDHILA
jgi:hypothetical protein